MDYTKEELFSKIKNYSQKYYEGTPGISDEEFDRLVDEYESQYGKIEQIGWGFDPSKIPLSKKRHKYGLVGSLSKVYEMTNVNLTNCIITDKLDGMSCVAYYVNGMLESAVTRGNGTFGVDVTNKYKFITGLTNIPDEGFTGAIRGELVMSEASWSAFKEKHPEYENSRNAVAGIINSKEIDKNKLSYISFVTYKIIAHEDIRNSNMNYDNIFNWLKDNGFTVVNSIIVDDYGKSVTTVDDMRDIYSSRTEYPCDGLVITNRKVLINNNGFFEYDEYAFKFKSETAETRVTGIDWNLTRTGKMIPTVLIEPVKLDGATIRRVTGFNAGYIRDNSIGIGALIEIERAGQVIPDIQRVIEDAMISLPKECPKCSHSLKWSGVNLICDNPDCIAKDYEKVYRFISIVGCKDVKNVGPALINDFIDYCVTLSGLSDKVDSMSRLVVGSKLVTPIDLSNNFGKATVDKYISILKNLSSPIDKCDFLYALNIPGLGYKTCEALVNAGVLDKMTDIEDISWTSMIYDIKGIGSTTVEALLKNYNYILNMKNIFALKERAVFRYVAVTGSLSRSRSEFDNFIQKYGWKVDSNIKNSEYLVTNNPDPTSSKGKKAKELGKPIITEEEFYKIILKS
jgi:DNA ligase (NAD+)